MKPRARPLDRLADANPRFHADRPSYPLRDLTDEERAQHDGLGYVKYETYPAAAHDEPGRLLGRFWTQARLDADPVVLLFSFECPFHEECPAGRVEIPTAPTNGPLGWGRSGTDLATLTITPSIRRGPAGGCCWHGFIRDGRFEHCADSR